MKARFTTKQQDVTWQPIDDDKVDVTICLNGQKVTEEIDSSEYFEYDFHQFREKLQNIDYEKVKSNPKKYMDYEPIKEKALEQIIDEQNEQIQMLTGCLMEMSEIIYE